MFLTVCMMYLFSLECSVPCFCHHLYAEKFGCGSGKKKVKFQSNKYFLTEIIIFDLYSAFSSRSEDLVMLTMWH